MKKLIFFFGLFLMGKIGCGSSMTAKMTQQQLKTTKISPGWDGPLVNEYEKRVEPFTSIFIRELSDPFSNECPGQANSASPTPPHSRPSILDVGCGSGFGSLWALERGFQVTATDISETAVRRIRERAGATDHLDCVVADGQELSSYVHKEHDYAIAAFSVIFFPDPLKGLKEIFHCLKCSGKVAVSAWGSQEETSAFQIFPRAFKQVLPENLWKKSKPNRIEGSPSTLYSLLENAGFCDVKVVGPIQHAVHVASPAAFYDRFALTSPKLNDTLSNLTTEQRNAVKREVMELAQREGGQTDGSISIHSSAYFAYGTKELL